MPEGTKHLTPFDAMRFLDDEMTAPEKAGVVQHLQGCARCDALIAETHGTLAAMSAAVQQTRVESDASRSRLMSAMEEVVSPRQPHWMLRIVREHRMALACTAAILIAAVSFHTAVSWMRPQVKDVTIALLPDKALTPGAVRQASLDELCRVPDDDNDLDPTVEQPTRNAVFHEYGIAADREKHYFQVDYLINPQLGGIDDVRNLWPQPYTSEWNAEAKDALERRLHQMVCERKIELADAQREIAENWIDAYKKYFHTSKPI